MTNQDLVLGYGLRCVWQLVNPAVHEEYVEHDPLRSLVGPTPTVGGQKEVPEHEDDPGALAARGGVDETTSCFIYIGNLPIVP